MLTKKDIERKFKAEDFETPGKIVSKVYFYFACGIDYDTAVRIQKDYQDGKIVILGNMSPKAYTKRI